MKSTGGRSGAFPSAARRRAWALRQVRRWQAKGPLLLMQNSGLGNCMNALASLTCLYRLPLFLLMSHRGGPGEQIAAQIPMGQAAPGVLEALTIAHIRSRNASRSGCPCVLYAPDI